VAGLPGAGRGAREGAGRAKGEPTSRRPWAARCAGQGCSLRDGWADLQKAGVNVLGVSTDDEKLQKEFKEEQNFPFRLLADKEKKAVTEAFGVKNLIGMAGRSAFLFKDGKCVYADHKGHTGDQAKVILDFLATEKK
jgi:peroxiredoxin